MEHLTPSEVMTHLNLQPSGSMGIFELARVVDTYVGCRRRRDGLDQRLTLRIFDFGLGHPGGWFICEMTTDDGKSATSHAYDLLEGAFVMDFWHDLDE
jgi:hypothetical protein